MKLIVCLLMLSSSVIAQRMKVTSGSLDGLKSITSYNIQFTYDSILVGHDIPEKKYLEKIRTRWNDRESGKGEVFVMRWFDDRGKLYEPAFIKNFEKYLSVKLNDNEAIYTLVLKTKLIEGGWDFGVTGDYARIGGELWIVESSNMSNVKAIIQFYDSQGIDDNGGDFQMTSRIKSAYAKTGQWLAIFMHRKLK